MEQMQQITESPAVSEYIAFISYRHKPLDKEAAERIQKAIERYTVPKEYREQVGGKRLGKVFRDEDELPISSSLSDSITYALDHSKYLIVVCTPDLPKSAWCEQEIRYFTGKYGRDRVIAVLADGNPSESFSPLLLHTFDETGNITGDTEPLAANIAGKNHTIDRGAFRKEIVRVYAALLGCPFDALWQRERRRKMNQTFALLGVTTLLLAGFSAYVLSKNAQITAKNEQITAQNEQITEQNTQITEQYDQISKQNEQITEQNEQITKQNLTLQRQLSSMKVDAGYTALKEYDVITALQNGLDALVPDEEGEELYDRRVRVLFGEALGSYDSKESRTIQIYRQNVPITQLVSADDHQVLLFTDEVGIVHCIEVPSGTILWDQELDYGGADKTCELILAEKNEIVLCKGQNFVSAFSLEDGTELWRYDYAGYKINFSTYRGSGLRGLSPDENTLVLLDGSPEKEENCILVMLDVNTGKKKAEIDIGAEGQRILANRTDKWFYNTADFSEDGKRLAVAVYSILLDENGEDKYIDDTTKEHRCDYYLIDTASWQIVESAYLEGFYSYGSAITYGCSLEPETYNVFCAQYRSEFGGIVINILDWAKDEYHTIITTQTIPADDGIFFDDPYKNCAVPVLGSGNRVAVCSGNTLFMFNRSTGDVYKGYEFTDAILDAWWGESSEQKITLLTASGINITIDYEMGYNAQEYSPGGVNRAEAYSDGILDGMFLYDDPNLNADGKVFLTMRETPGTILLTSMHTDEGRTEVPGQPDEFYSSASSVMLSPSGERLFVFYYMKDGGYTVGVYDPLTYENLETVCFPDMPTDEPCVMDDTHFIINNVVYGLDGSEKTLQPQNGVSKREFEYNSECESRILSNGHVLTVSKVYAGETGMTYCWLDGEPLEIDPKAGNGTWNTPESGYNGLVVSLPSGEDIVILDAMSGEISAADNPYPLSSDPILSIGTEKRVFGISDGEEITIFNLDTMIADEYDLGYVAGEIQSFCFAPGDEYLVVHTVAGRIDFWDLTAESQVYSQNMVSYVTDVVSCEKDPETGDLYLFLKSQNKGAGEWIGLDTKSWVAFAHGEETYLYLPQSTAVVEFQNKRFRFKEVYTLDELAEAAREALGLNNNWGIISPVPSEENEE